MQFFISQKSLGKRNSPDVAAALVKNHPIQLDITTPQIEAQDLIVKLVTQQVNEFNRRIEQQKQALKATQTMQPAQDLPSSNHIGSKHATDTVTPTLMLTQQTIDTYLFNVGKVDFANIANLTMVSLDDALNNALQAFQDGLFVMFVDDVEVKSLGQTIAVFEGCNISFIRLTFLAGGWF